MSGWILSIFLIAALTVAWIEFLQKRFDGFVVEWIVVSIVSFVIISLSNWLILAILVFVLLETYRLYREYDAKTYWGDLRSHLIDVLKTLASVVLAGARYLGRWLSDASGWAVEKTKERRRIAAAEDRKRRWPTVLALIAFSPIAAIPVGLVLATVAVVGSVVIDLYAGQNIEFDRLLSDWFTVALMSIFLGLDLLIRGYFFAIPVLGFAAFVGAIYAQRPGVFWRRFVIAAMAVGTLYPAVTVLAQVVGWDMAALTN